MNFEWDTAKNQSNIVKHGIDFCYAIRIFEDDDRLECEDNRFEYGEPRYITIGKIEKLIYTLVYTLRNSCHRIISARGASRYEREAYQAYIKEKK